MQSIIIMVTAIVLAAGLSKRMGKHNKLLLPYKNKPIIAVTIENILSSGFKEPILITGYEAEKIKAAIQQLPVEIIYNPDYEKGMTTSIQCGIRHAQGDGYMICLADMFMINPDEYKILYDSFENAFKQNNRCICLPRFQDEKGNPVIFSSFYKEQILQHTNMEGCKAIVESNKENIYWTDMPTDHILQDMDYYSDYEKLIQ